MQIHRSMPIALTLVLSSLVRYGCTSAAVPFYPKVPPLEDASSGYRTHAIGPKGQGNVVTGPTYRVCGMKVYIKESGRGNLGP